MNEIIKWNDAGYAVREAVAVLCGWHNRKGAATPMGKRIARSKSSELSTAALDVLKKHGIII